MSTPRFSNQMGGIRSREMTVFTVVGQPAPQGSKVAFVNKHTGKAQMIESSKAGVEAWRSEVKAVATETFRDGPIVGPVEVSIIFNQTRPKAHHGTGRNAGILKDSAPEFPTNRPDVDKLVRSTLDAITGVGFVDDSSVVKLSAEKHYGDPGAHITIRSLARTQETA